MASSNKESRERSTFAKICSILVDIFVVPIIILAFVSTILRFTSKRNNEMPSILGNGIVEVLSNSMEPTHKVGDILVINQSFDLDKIKVNDCIAFYSPTNSTYKDQNGNSIVLLHRVVRIIWADDADGNTKRYFVCHGDNVGGLEFIPTTDGTGGDYNKNHVPMNGGGYVVRILNDTQTAPVKNTYSQSDIDKESHTILQYITDENIVGIEKAKASPFISGVVRFCSSIEGIVALVLIPSAFLIYMVIVGMVDDAKRSKKEKEAEQAAISQTMGSIVINELPKDESKEQENKELLDVNKEITLNEEEKTDDILPSKKPPEKPQQPKKPNIKTEKEEVSDLVTAIKTVANVEDSSKENKKVPAKKKQPAKKLPPKVESGSTEININIDANDNKVNVKVKKAPPKPQVKENKADVKEEVKQKPKAPAKPKQQTNETTADNKVEEKPTKMPAKKQPVKKAPEPKESSNAKKIPPKKG